MINYRKKITLSLIANSENEWNIHTDRGDRYRAFAITGNNIWTSWNEMQVKSELRSWQKEIMREFANRYFEDLVPYIVYKPRQGQNQDHDISIAYSKSDGTWLIMTIDDFWIVPITYGEFTVERNINSMGKILDMDVRKSVIYPILDNKINV